MGKGLKNKSRRPQLSRPPKKEKILSEYSGVGVMGNMDWKTAEKTLILFDCHNLKFCGVKSDLFYSFYTPLSKFFCGLASFRCGYLLAIRRAKSQRSHLHNKASSSALTVSAPHTLW